MNEFPYLYAFQRWLLNRLYEKYKVWRKNDNKTLDTIHFNLENCVGGTSICVYVDKTLFHLRTLQCNWHFPPILSLSFSHSISFSVTHPLFLELQLTQCLHLVQVEIPEYCDIKDVVRLSCSYNMGQAKLNSVKWYKDNQEFFRWHKIKVSASLLWFNSMNISSQIRAIDGSANINVDSWGHQFISRESF